MIAVFIASSVPSSAYYILSAVTVAALGIGPLASWIASMPSPRRFVYATLLAWLFASLCLLLDPHVRASLAFAWDGCYWFPWDPFCWAWGG